MAANLKLEKKLKRQKTKCLQLQEKMVYYDEP